ncbi:hypothetical protein [Dyella tabacisoli]|uniref:Uncharacterized protein n=1 Tax=Dyella tabacisoli TaxID=2282381 RepID=A0A369UGF4_9GAMM|nr:hypothetical protein [Dyella tabacisoli]RDD79804.1 hypothetical protein DVJ77_20275 [Dyella tabacisoli]
MKATAGGAIAIVLLAIYVYLIVAGCLLVGSQAGAAADAQIPAHFNDVMSQTLSVIGGLVSALVIAELAITKPGEAPVARVLAVDASARSKNILMWVTGLYILVWLLAGLAAFMVGMNSPNKLPPLTSVGQSWFGLAVAAAYAYFGLKPQ